MDKASRSIWGDLQLAVILIFTALPVLVLSIYLYRQSIGAERSLVRLYTEIIAKSLARRLENFASTRTVAIGLFAAYYEGSARGDDGLLAALRERFIEDYPEFSTLIYIDERANLSQIYPRQDGVAAGEKCDKSGLLDAISAGLATREGRVALKASLACAHEAITIARAVIKNAKPSGVALGLIRVAEGLEPVFGEEVRRYCSVGIWDSQGQLMYSRDSGQEPSRHGDGQEVSGRFCFGEGFWALAICPQPALQGTVRTEWPERILICGALTTVLIICGVSALYWRQRALRLALIETRRVNAAIKSSEKHFHNVMQRVHLLGVVLDADARILFCNDRFLQTCGYTREQVIGANAIELLTAPQDRLGYRKLREDVNAGRVRELNSQINLMTHDGKIRQIAWNHVISRGADDQVELLISLGEDITDRLAQEEAQRQAQKLESLGVLAGGIAHDFNNLLTTIIGHNDLALRKAGADSSLRPHLDNIARTARRLADLTSQMLTYSGRGRFEVREVDLNTLLEEMASLLRMSIPKRVEISYELAPDLPRIAVDPTQVEQVVLNLLTNAAESIPKRRGHIKLKTLLDVFSADNLPSRQMAPGSYLELSVEDNGCGIDSDILSRIFDPFFTTKFTGRGLGLAVLQGIVRGHGGAVTVDSLPGLGTTFHVYFPLRPNPSSRCVAAPEPLSPQQQTLATPTQPTPAGKYDLGATVLIIDDEESIRMLASDILQAAGFKTLSAPDGESGVALYKRHQRDIAVILLDLTMPGMGGEAAFGQLRALNPAVRVVITSGYSNREVQWQFQDKNLAGFVHKPFLPQELSEKIISVALNTPSPQNN